MIRKLLVLNMIVFCLHLTAHAVTVPDFSFEGEEISAYSVTPTFVDLKFDFNVKSEYAKYAEAQTLTLGKTGQDSYDTGEPSFVFSYRPTTAIASVFIGDRAYRNYIVKLYFNGYTDKVKESYKSYFEKVDDPEYKEEIFFLYAMSLESLGEKQGEIDLRKACLNGKFFKTISCDRYVQLLWDQKRYAGIVEMGDKLSSYSAYTFEAYLLSLFKRGEYKKAGIAIKENPEFLYLNPSLNDMHSIVEYYRGNYSNVLKLMPLTTDGIAFINADSLINERRHYDAEKYIEAVSSIERRGYLSAKLAIARNKYKESAFHLKKLKSETEKLELLKFYITINFPNVSSRFINLFDLKQEGLKDYAYYYEGLLYFNNKQYSKASEFFSKVKSPPNLVSEATFYKGISLIHVDPNKAEKDIIKIMNTSSDSDQVNIARFMLAQTYYLRGRNFDAEQLVEGCDKSYCKQLQAEIALKQDRPSDALGYLLEINTPRARLIRAGAYFNMMDYAKVREELSAIPSYNKDSTHLRMMLAFKENRHNEALSILNSNKNNNEIVYDGVKELMLLGDYKLAARLLNDGRELSFEMQVASAKLYAHSGNIKKAEEIYRNLLASNSYLYDAYFGIISLNKGKKAELESIDWVLNDIDQRGDFPQKDLLLVQISSIASRLNNNVFLTKTVNKFFPMYDESKYAPDMYAHRAKLFLLTGRSKECLADISNASANPDVASELIFLKAECTELTDKGAAIQDYRQMFNDDKNRYRLPAAVKLMDLTDKPMEVLSVAEKVKVDTPRLYIEGVRRFMEIATVDDLKKKKSFIGNLQKSKDKSLVCAGLFGKARLLNEQGKGVEAAKAYHKIYMTDPADHYTKQALKNAASIYSQLGHKAESDEMNKLLKNLK